MTDSVKCRDEVVVEDGLGVALAEIAEDLQDLEIHHLCLV